MSIAKENERGDEKTFLNEMLVLELAFTLNGPCGFGGRQAPNSGMLYSPPCADDKFKIARLSDRVDGSNEISKDTSIPLGVWLGAAGILLSTLKSEFAESI